ncbi:MAG: porin [Flavobacteriales bacterium]|nr:porin [Flavobacteriales bacterium]
MLRCFFSIIWILILSYKSYSQDSVTIIKKAWIPNISLEAYIEAYYQYDFNRPIDGNRPSFVYSFNRHNEFNINLSYLKTKFQHDRYRANLAFMAGTYSQANLANEPPLFRHILEANIGFRLAKGLWLDGGIFPSYIGFESTVGMDCYNVTRSILADNSPYFFSGIKLGYTTPNEKLYFATLIINGWQNIHETPFNSNKALGLQIQIMPTDKITLNYSNFIGYETPDSAKHWRFFNNIYGIFNIHQHFQCITGLDIGIQEKQPGNLLNVHLWYSPVLIVRTVFAKKFALALRGEYYHDRKGIIVNMTTPGGIKTWGISMNFDYHPWEYLICRLEGKFWMNTSGKIFQSAEGSSRFSPVIIASIAFRYGLLLNQASSNKH